MSTASALRSRGFDLLVQEDSEPLLINTITVNAIVNSQPLERHPRPPRAGAVLFDPHSEVDIEIQRSAWAPASMKVSDFFVDEDGRKYRIQKITPTREAVSFRCSVAGA